LPLALIFGLVLLLSLDVGQTNAEAGASRPLESWLKLLVGYLAAGAEIAAALVIGGAVIRGILTYLSQLFSRFLAF
jgi:type IV secretory pathway VirB2 component (pilin)